MDGSIGDHVGGDRIGGFDRAWNVAMNTANRSKLDRLVDWMVEDLLALSDEETLAEIIGDGGNPREISAEVEIVISKAITQHRQRRAEGGLR